MASLNLKIVFFALFTLFTTINGVVLDLNDCEGGCDVTRGGCPGCACYRNFQHFNSCLPLCTPCARCEPWMEVESSCEIYESCPLGCNAIDRGGLLCSCTGETTLCPGSEPVGPTDGLFMCQECKNNLVLSDNECCVDTCNNGTICDCDEPGPYCTCPEGLVYDSDFETCVEPDRCITPSPVCGDCTTSAWDGCNVCGCAGPIPFCTLRACFNDTEFFDPPRCFTGDVTCPINCLEYDTGCEVCTCFGESAACGEANETAPDCGGTGECLECVNNLVWNEYGSVCTKTCEFPDVVCRGIMARCECPPEFPIYDERTQTCTTERECPVRAEECANCNTRSFDGCNECDCSDPYNPVCTEMACPPSNYFEDGIRCLDPLTECSINCLEYNNGCQTCSCRDNGAFCDQIFCFTNGPKECLECARTTRPRNCPGSFENCIERDVCEEDEIICDCPGPRGRRLFDPYRNRCVQRCTPSEET